MNYKTLTYNLLFLFIPVAAIVAWFLYDTAGGSVGGGGYNLGDLYSPVFCIGYIILYEAVLAAIIFYLYRKNRKWAVENIMAWAVSLALLLYFIVILSLKLK